MSTQKWILHGQSLFPSDSIKSMRNAIFRVDANPAVGFGHAMRMKSLADECLASGWRTTLIGDIPEFLMTTLIAQGHGVLLLNAHLDHGVEKQVLDTIKALSGRIWVILDGYQFNERHQLALRAQGVQLMVMDDHCHLPSYSADLLVNQNSGAERLPYQISGGCACLLGLAYVLLRKEFTPWRPWRRTHPDRAQRLLLTVGGADPLGISHDLLLAIERAEGPELDIHVICGVANPRETEIKALAQSGRHRIQVSPLVEDMPALMAWADVALIAAGSTLLEAAHMSLPAVAFALADNQRSGAEALGNLGAVNYVGEIGDVCAADLANEVFGLIKNRMRREIMGAIGRELIDGRGAERLRLAMEVLS